jgi:HAE1 family hydrophobic/amphiphilic exporter-1
MWLKDFGNASLIVESAKLESKRGTPLTEGTRLRLRPIIMTSFAFILACVPLWTGSGSGAAAGQVMT